MEKEGSGRSKRVKADKTGRFAAIEKLKLLKGSKNKYEVIDEAPVYEEVNEKDFSKIVQQRQEDDWIVDDDGSGYVEDGREIFDDDEDAAAAYTSKKTSQAVKKKSLVPEKKSVNGRMGNIKNMFQAQPVKRKNESDIKLDEDDDLLGNILESVHNNSSPLTCLPKPMLLQKKSKRSLGPLLPASPLTRPANNPFAVKPSHSVGGKDCFPLRKPLQPKIVNFDVADTMLDRQIDKNLEAIKNEEEKVDAASFDLKMETEMLAEMDTFDDFSASNDLFAIENFSQATVPEEKIEPMACSEELFEDSGFIESVFNPAPEIKTHPIDIVIDPKSLPLTVLESGESVLRFFWFDAFEDSFKHPGVVYLFGKIYIQASQSYVSCCVIIKDIPRRIYVLPRETKMNVATKADTGKPITMTDVYLEINSITEKMKISEFKTKKTKKKYAFDNTDIPDECEYLEMQYSATFPALPSDMSGSTFSHVLGTDTSSLEILLLEQKLKGPCWIDVHVPQLSCPPVSWCKIEAVVHNYQHIVPVDKTLPIPPLVVFSMNIITNVNSKTQQNEIAAISCVSHNDFPLDKVAPKPHYNVHFCALSKPSDCIFPYDLKTVLLSNKNMNIENLDSERALLAYFLAKLHKADPDVIIGHDILGFGLDVLLHRVAFHKIPNWSRVGRLKRSGAPRFSNFSHGSSFEKNVTCGRLLCDIKISAKELLRLPSYELTELAGNILQLKYQEISAENLRDCYSTSTKLMQLVNNTMTAADIILRINCELNILPLALQITNIAGCVMSRTLLGGRSERNEFLLLHAFHEKNYIYPAKVSGKKGAKPTFENRDDATGALAETKPGRRKPAYEGGLVLDPKIGFYDKYILLMDFNSLYPSIIQEYNICFTTIDRVPNMDKKTEDELFIKLQEVVSDPGVLPTEIRKLVDSRKQVKNMMKAPDVSKDRLVQFDIRQRALKLTANSMYGCLGFTHSRFYAKFLAALITRKGREVLMQTKELVEKMGLDVIYGDTDSIMINTNQIDIDDVFQLGNKVKVEINKLYRLLEIDIDGVYKSMLLLKKKKYAALAVSRLPNGQIVTKEEMKGLDIVRRDWSQLAKTAGEFVIKQILSSKPKEDVLEIIHAHLIALGEDVLSGKRPISDFIIMKQLNKNPEDYPDMKSLPHVTVALRLNAKGGKKIRQHDTVPYIVCKDGTDLPNTQRAYHPEELKSDEKLSIDFEYYLANQVHPVISRLCAPIDGTDAAIIAKLLGLNPSKYVASIRQEEQYEDKSLPSSSFDDEERFKSCDKLIFQCPAKDCSEKITVDVVLKVETQPWQLALTTCPKCNANFEDFPAALCNQLQKITRPYIFTYYKKILVCEDVGCAYQTRKIPLIFSNGGPVCPLCRKANLLAQYTESQLYTQLAYFSYLFDIDKCLKKLGNDSGKVMSDLYSQLKKTADKTLKSSSYGEVNLSILFHGLFIKPSTTI